MSDSLAVDIVLLPPDEVMDRATVLNHEYETQFILNKIDCLPHITLLQAVLSKNKLDEAKAILGTVASDFEPINLTASLTTKPVFMFGVEKSSELIKLHEQILKQVEYIVSYDARPEYFYDKDVTDKTVAWVNDFVANSAHNKFMPHITLAVSNSPNKKETINFTCSRLAICHLGNYNTCRQILFETSLIL